MTLREEIMLAEAEFAWRDSRREFAEAQIILRKLRRLKTIQLRAELATDAWQDGPEAYGDQQGVA